MTTQTATTPSGTAGTAGTAAPAAATRRKPRTARFYLNRAGRAALSLIAIVIGLIWVFPVYWMINSAFLSNATLSASTPTFLPFGGSLNNFRQVLQHGNFGAALRMSLIVTLTTVVIVLLFAFLAALAISRYKFRGRKSFVLAVLFIQMLPAEGLFLAQHSMMKELGLLNSWLGVTIIYVAAVVPFTVWMLRGFVAGVPADLEEAAMVDGLSRTKAFFRITFPLLAPGLVASGVYAFLQAWNEFTVAFVLLDSDKKTLPLWLRGFIQQSSQQEIDWGQVMAASTLVAVPVIIFFLIVQGRMTSGLVAGAVKG
ncbi:MAG: carbohydrate ABC transporter permease [Bifidobacteriaceae bacterium]|jgi:N,N'-diacetylchitobiose transport system permease protein|nr:carbohydrate ABC transporter permease [Bifidobacteriaceae bacterium]